jgi:hypothetical protein
MDNATSGFGITSHIAIRIAIIMGEIVTLQIGTSSNYVATHYWNTQVRSEASVTTYKKYNSLTNV